MHRDRVVILDLDAERRQRPEAERVRPENAPEAEVLAALREGRARWLATRARLAVGRDGYLVARGTPGSTPFGVWKVRRVLAPRPGRVTVPASCRRVATRRPRSRARGRARAPGRPSSGDSDPDPVARRGRARSARGGA
jgi:hypothetical protein